MDIQICLTFFFLRERHRDREREHEQGGGMEGGERKENPKEALHLAWSPTWVSISPP